MKNPIVNMQAFGGVNRVRRMPKDLFAGQPHKWLEKIGSTFPSRTVVANHPVHGRITEADLSVTAHNHGLTREQALQAIL